MNNTESNHGVESIKELHAEAAKIALYCEDAAILNSNEAVKRLVRSAAKVIRELIAVTAESEQGETMPDSRSPSVWPSAREVQLEMALVYVGQTLRVTPQNQLCEGVSLLGNEGVRVKTETIDVEVPSSRERNVTRREAELEKALVYVAHELRATPANQLCEGVTTIDNDGIRVKMGDIDVEVRLKKLAHERASAVTAPRDAWSKEFERLLGSFDTACTMGSMNRYVIRELLVEHARKKRFAAVSLEDSDALFAEWAREEGLVLAADSTGLSFVSDACKTARQAWDACANRGLGLQAVGEAGPMPGSSGFTMACFRADEVPVKSKLFMTRAA